MSNNFEQFQKKICDDALDPLPLKKLCPTCTPNKSFIAPDWREMIDETYLDEAACEYRICVTINNEGRSFTSSEMRGAITTGKYLTREHLFRSFIHPAIRLMLEDTDKLIAQQIICASHEGPAVAGRVPNELLQEYDSFDDVFMKLKDEPVREAQDCPDLLTKVAFGSTSFDPEEPLSFTQFVLQNIPNEIKNPFALELYARAIDFHIDPLQNLLKVLISIPAFILDAVPDNPTIGEIQTEALSTKTTVEIDVKSFFLKITRLKSALYSYSKYQSYFYQTQNGFLKFKDSERDYYASSFTSKIDSFYEDLKAEANHKSKPKAKRWNIRSNIPSVQVKNADKLRITFKQVGANPYVIKLIEAKIDGCDWQVICRENSKFAKKYKNKPTLMNYIAKINEIDVALQARESYPWLDFLVKFTYPLLVVDYGTLNEESVTESMGECVSNNVKEFGGELKDYVLNEALSLVEAIAYEFNSKESCLELRQDSEIEKKYFQADFDAGLTAKKETNKKIKKDALSELDAELNRLRGEADSLRQKESILESSYKTIEDLLELRESDALDYRLNGGDPEVGSKISSDIEQYKKKLLNLEKEIESTQKEIRKIIEKSQKLNDVAFDDDISNKAKRNIRRNQAQRARKERRSQGSPYWKEAKRLALEELKHQDGILASLVDLETFMTTGQLDFKKAEKTEPKKLLERLTLCKVQSLTINAVQCLFSGVTQEVAFHKMVESALKAMDVDVLGYFIQALPPQKQFQLREMAREKWANMPMPWEEGYKSGSSEKSNPYLKYLGTNSNQQGVEVKKQQLNNQITSLGFEIQGKATKIETLRREVSADADRMFEIDQQVNVLTSEKLVLQKELDSKKSELEKYKEEDFSKLPESRQNELILAQTKSQGTFGTALGDIQSSIINMYIENIMDVMEIDELMSILDRFPGGAIVQRYLNQVACSYQGLNNPPVKSFLSTLSLDPCGDGNIGLGFPSKMRDFNMRDLKPFRKSALRVLRNKFIDKLETVLTNILVKMILKLILSVDNALCKSLNAIGQAASDILSGETQGLDDAMREAFCPDANDDELDEVKKNAFNNALGKGGLGAPNTAAYDCLFQTMNATMSKQEVINLLTNTPSNMDPNIIEKLSQLVNSRCPELSDVLGDSDGIKDCFGSMQKFVPPELRDFLRQQASQQPEGPIFDSICLTQEELDQWNNDRKSIYMENGLDEETAQELVDKANDRVLDDLGTVSDMLQKGTDGMLNEAIDALLNQGDPACATDPSAIVLEDEDLARDKLEILNDFFKSIEKSFITDLIEGRNSILNNILIDTWGSRFNRHEDRVNNILARPNYVDSDEQWETRKEEALFQKDVGGFGFPYDEDRKKGMFPETVGGRMLENMKDMNLRYDSKLKNTVVMRFSDDEKDPDYESKLIFRVLNKKVPTHYVRVDETFHRRMSRKEKKKLGLSFFEFGSIENRGSSKLVNRDTSVSDMSSEVDYSVFQDGYNIETVLFRNFLMKKSNVLIGDSRLSQIRDIVDSWNLKALEFVRRSIVERPNGSTPLGFNYGADEQAKIKFHDMLYVNPESDPSDESTWKYDKDEEEQILGKSATEHPRVHFLDPAIHGGSYTRPKLYIEPATYDGWLGMIKTFVPQMELCGDVDNGFLQVNDISRRAKRIESSLPVDKRISQPPECRFEIPYDIQMTPANHGIIEGIVLSIIRTYGTEFILRIIPTIGSIKMSSKNYDNTLFLMMSEKMEQEFSGDSDWELSSIKSYTYYLLFLEQSVQVVQRQMKDGLIEETETLKNAALKINRAQIDYERTTTFSQTVFNQIAKGSAIIGYNTKWEEKYEEPTVGSKVRENIKKMSPAKSSLARKLAVIHDTKRHAEVFLAALMKKELEGLTKRIEQNLRPLPHVHSITKYAVSKNGFINFSNIISGDARVEVDIIEGGSKPSYGTIYDCPDESFTSKNIDEINNMSEVPEEGLMFLEKYLRVISKEGSEKVMTIGEFKSMITDPSQYDQALKVSDYFGNATLLNQEVLGTIGVKFGVRLIYVPSLNSGFKSNLDESIERVGMIGDYHHIPIASYEHDIMDKVISDIDFEDENMGEELKCYIDKLSETDDFKFVFETMIKTTAFSSMFAIYSYYNFFESIGKGTGEVEEDRKKKIRNGWKRKVFKDTKKILKKQFRATYQTDDDEIKEENRNQKKQNDAEWLNNLLPESYLGIDSSVRQWQLRRLIDHNPFNSDGEDCLNDFQKIFRK